MSPPVTHEHLSECRETVTKEFTDLLGNHIEDEEARYERIEKQLDSLATNVETLMKLFEQSKGALAVVRMIAIGAAGLWAFILWFNDHIKL